MSEGRAQAKWKQFVLAFQISRYHGSMQEHLQCANFVRISWMWLFWMVELLDMVGTGLRPGHAHFFQAMSPAAFLKVCERWWVKKYSSDPECFLMGSHAVKVSSFAPIHASPELHHYHLGKLIQVIHFGTRNMLNRIGRRTGRENAKSESMEFIRLNWPVQPACSLNFIAFTPWTGSMVAHMA